ncbi:ferric reductase like transmembrane component domain-containing protein [Trichoderma austrokoningii]
MRAFTHALYLSHFAHVAIAALIDPKSSPDLCVKSCESSFQSLRYVDVSPAASALQQACQSRLALSSTYLCLGFNCGKETREQALRQLNATCCALFGSSIPTFKTDFTDKEITGLKRINKNDSFSSENPLQGVVIPSPELFSAWFDTLDASEYARKHHYLYSVGVMAFWIFVAFLGVSHKVYLVISRMYYNQSHFPSVGIRSHINSWFKRNITIPATFGYRCAQNVWWATIPPRVQTITLLIFLLMNIAFNIHGYKIIDESLYFSTPTKQVLRYVSDRTGIISFANFPFIWLFGMRNNVALWLTGWDFGTYNNFHRWCARIATVEAVIHSVLYTVLIFMNGGLNYYAWWFTMWFWNAGQLATISMCAVLMLSMYWIRRRFYEAFLVIHIGLSILILLTMLGHVSIFNGEYDALFWVPAIIWVADRMMRLLRIIIFNPGHWSTTALASYDNSANIVRLTVPTGNALYKPQPGNYFFLSILDDSNSWESHPFTVASISDEMPQKIEGPEESLPLLASMTAAPELNSQHKTLEARKEHMTFLIRPYDGFTMRLRDMSADEELITKPLRILVDGPYGHTQRLQEYHHVIFIAGGSGVVVALSYLTSLCKRMDAPAKIDLFWAVRESAFAKDILSSCMLSAEIKAAIDTGRLSLKLYMSSQLESFDISSLPSQLQQHIGRPDIDSVIRSAARNTQAGSMAVVACGPAKLADDSRLAVVNALKEGNHHIDYYEESFTW